jgi:hypothetical protein
VNFAFVRGLHWQQSNLHPKTFNSSFLKSSTRQENQSETIMKTVKKIIPHKLRSSNPNMGLLLAGFLLCVLAIPARAVVTLQDIYDEVVDAQTKLNSISTKVTTTIPNAVSNVKNDTTEMIGNLHSGTALLVGDVNTMLTETANDLAAKASAELAGRTAFLSNPTNGPAQFRSNLASFLASLQAIENTLNDLAGTNGRPLNLAAEIQLINAAPDVAMFPLSKAFQVVDFPKLTAQLSEATATLQTLRAALPDDACDVIMANLELFEHAVTAAKTSSIALKLSSKIVEALASRIPEAGVGVWGFPHLRFKENTASTAAKVLETISEGLEKFAKLTEEHLTSCKLNELLSQLSSVQTVLSNLNTKVASGASQASVDALAVSLGSVTAPLDAPVSTRATQASMDALTNMAEDQQTTALRLQVELQLSDNTRQLSSFYLPEAMGGKLGFVRSVVAETIATNEAAGLYSGILAGQKLQAGDAAAAANDFHAAFDNYRQAYQEVVKWPVTSNLKSSAATGALNLSWTSDPGGIYAVETSSNLLHWSSFMAKVIGAPGNTVAPLTAPGDLGFYRVFRLSSYDPSANEQ